MEVDPTDLILLKNICHKICLNIPNNCQWHWDHDREMACVEIGKEDAELVFFPLFKEFKYNWDYSSEDLSEASVASQKNHTFGLLPGQVFFSSGPIGNVLLLVAWWPWGKNDKISMRVGIMPANQKNCQKGFSYDLLNSWLKID